MQLTAIVGDTFKQVSKGLFDKLKQINNKDLSATHYLIVPDRASLSCERELVSVCGGSFNIQVLTLRRLASKFVATTQYLSKQGALLVLHQIIKDNAKSLTCLHSCSAARLAESVYEVICSLKYNRIKPNSVSAQNLKGNLKAKFADIMLLYEKYENYLGGAIADSADKMEMFSDALDNNPKLKNAYFYFKDFDNYSAQEVAILRKLTQFSKGVTVAVPTKNEAEEKRILYLNDIFDTLLLIAQGLAIKLEVIAANNKLSDFSNHISQNMFLMQPQTSQTNLVNICACKNVSEEVTALAVALSKHVRSGGRYRDFTVIATDTQVYSACIEEIFSRSNIPFYIDKGMPLAEHALAQQIFNFVDLSLSGQTVRQVVAYTKNIFFQDAKPIEVFAFDVYCRKYNPSRRFGKIFELGKNDAEFVSAERVRERFAGEISVGTLGQKDLCKNFVCQIEKFLAHIKAKEKLEALADKQAQNNATVNAAVTRQVWDKLLMAFEEIVATVGEKVWELEEFSQALQRVLYSINLSALPPKVDIVEISDMSKARNHLIKHLWVLGAVDKMFPIVKADTKLLSDANLRQLKEQGVELNPNIRLENARENFSVFNLLCEPSESLSITYNMVTQKGKASAPSSAVVELERLFGQTALDLQGAFCKEEARYKIVKTLRKFTDGTLDDLSAISAQYHALDEKLENLVHTQSPVKKIKDVNLLDSGVVGITTLESYYSCPYACFLGKTLRLRKITKFDLEANRLGELLHLVLEKFVNGYSEDMTDSQIENCIQKAIRLALENDFVKAAKENSVLRLMLNRLKEESRQICLFIANTIKNSSFKPYKCEYNFKDFVVNVDGVKISLGGRIDRIDVCDDEFFVLDYKSGSKVDFYPKDLYTGKKLQLLSYLIAAGKKLGKKPVGFYYLRLRYSYDGNLSYVGKTLSDKKVISKIDNNFATSGKSQVLRLRKKNDGELYAGNHLPREELQGCLTYTKIMIRQAIKNLINGDISILPLADVCKFCDYSDICSFGDLFVVPKRSCNNVVDEQMIASIGEEFAHLAEGFDEASGYINGESVFEEEDFYCDEEDDESDDVEVDDD